MIGLILIHPDMQGLHALRYIYDFIIVIIFVFIDEQYNRTCKIYDPYLFFFAVGKCHTLPEYLKNFKPGEFQGISRLVEYRDSRVFFY